MSERNFRVTLTARTFEGRVQEVNMNVTLDVGESATDTQVVRAFWRKLSETGHSELYRLPDWDTVLGFDLVKITGRQGSGEYVAVERADMETYHDEPKQFRVFADAVMHDGSERTEPMGSYSTNRASEAKRQAWEKLKNGGMDWCATAATAESVTFRVMTRDVSETVHFDASTLESADESEDD